MNFQEMISRGLGRAILFIQAHDAMPYREEIEYACTHFLGYDAQSEPSRGRYLFDIIHATKEPEFYHAFLQDVLKTGKGVESWFQLYDTVRCFVKEGDAVMRNALRAAFLRDLAEGEYYDAGSSVIEAEGFPGYLFVVEQMASLTLSEHDQSYESLFLFTLEDQIGQKAAQTALNKVRKTNARMAAVVERVRQYDAEKVLARQKRIAFAVPTYDELTRIIHAPNRGNHYFLGRWGEKASNDLILHLANDLLLETDHQAVLNYLYLFRKRRFPLKIDCLLAFAQGDDEEIALAACEALSHRPSPKIRALAMDFISSSRRLETVISLLGNNFKTGDHRILESLVMRNQSKHEFHSLGIGVREVIKAHPSPEMIPILKHLYEGGYCAMCRGSVVSLWQSIEPLPYWMRQECQYDSDEETRRFVLREERDSQ